jgi:hypothetical protein
MAESILRSSGVGKKKNNIQRSHKKTFLGKRAEDQKPVFKFNRLTDWENEYF